MKPHDWPTVEELYRAALARGPGQSDAFLAQASLSARVCTRRGHAGALGAMGADSRNAGSGSGLVGAGGDPSRGTSPNARPNGGQKKSGS